MSAARSIWRGAMMASVMRIGVAAITFGFFAVLARHWGAERLGEFSSAFALFVMLQQVPVLGLHFVLIRDVAQNPDRSGDLVSNIAIIGLTIALVLAVVVVVVARLLYPPSLHATMLLVGIALVPSVLTTTGEALFIAREQFETVAAITVAESMVRSLLWLVTIAAGLGVVSLLVSLLACRTATAWIYWTREHGLSSCFERRFVNTEAVRILLRASPPFLGILLLAACVSRLDFLVLSITVGPVALGLYSAPYRIVEGLLLIPQALTVAMFPHIARTCVVDPADVETLSLEAPKFTVVATAIRGSVLLGFPAAIGLATLASWIVPRMFGHSFSPAVSVLVLLAVMPVPVAIDQVLGSLLLANHRQRADLIVMTVSGAFYLFSLVILVPTHGFRGAAIATLLTAVVQVSTRYLAVVSTIRVRGLLRLVMRPALGALVSGVIAFLLHARPFLATVTSLSVYLLLMVVLRALSYNELRAMRDMVTARFYRTAVREANPTVEVE